jgi:aminopeptidase N
VGCLINSYNENKKENTLGENFDFKQWVDSWLTTKGINNLEPIIVYNPDKSIKSLEIKQSNEKTSNNRLRKQIIDIAVYDKDYNKFIISNVVINDNQILS